MEIKQFEDVNLAHYSYAILSKGEIALIDPSRNPQQYYDFAKQKKAKITSVIETHPHADFVSSHLEINKTCQANIYVSKLLGAEYKHKNFDEGDEISLGNITLKAINTPGHSPDSISILVIDENGKQHAVFTGDTLFVGDCGRPDLREQAGKITAARQELAKQMYYSLREKLLKLPDDVILLPAHGAGTLCGKGLSSKSSSTIGDEKNNNWSLQIMSENEFVNELLADQPFVPKYFPFDVTVNKKGANDYASSIAKVKRLGLITLENYTKLIDSKTLIIDSRPKDTFKNNRLKNAINIMNGAKFETWLGAIVNPKEAFYLIAENDIELNHIIERIAKIAYENQIVAGFTMNHGIGSQVKFDTKNLTLNTGSYTIVDVRNYAEVKANKIFDNSIHIPLNELRERTKEIPKNKPILVHCAGGYRSAVGSSILQTAFGNDIKIYDLGEDVKEFQK